MPEPLQFNIHVQDVSFHLHAIEEARTYTAAFIGFIPALPASSDAAENNLSPTVFLPTLVVGDPKRIQTQKITLPDTQTTKFYCSLTQFKKDYGDLIGDPKADDARKAAQEKAEAAQGDEETAALTTLAQLGPPVLDAAEAEDFAPNTSKRQTLDAWRNLVHAVHGFFHNGGTRCYVVNAGYPANLQSVLDQQFAGLDDIATVAAPGLTIGSEQDKLVAHCSGLGDRIAVLDPQPVGASATANAAAIKGAAQNSSYAALYFPNIQVFDPTTQLLQQAQTLNSAPTDGGIFIGPSGHIAGVYARVDMDRGVHKAPSHTPLIGVIALQYIISSPVSQQLKSASINCLRVVRGKVQVMGARTLANSGDEFEHVHVRRYVSFLRVSLSRGTQWTVFEPNDSDLWERLRRDVSSFLFRQWQSGALVGATPQQAFFVTCDTTTNTPAEVEQGALTFLIGVALLKPSEFIILSFKSWEG